MTAVAAYVILGDQLKFAVCYVYSTIHTNTSIVHNILPKVFVDFRVLTKILALKIFSCSIIQ